MSLKSLLVLQSVELHPKVQQVVSSLTLHLLLVGSLSFIPIASFNSGAGYICLMLLLVVAVESLTGVCPVLVYI